MLPLRWHWNSWESKAKENPYFAVMSTSEMEGVGAKEPAPELLDAFFAKGRELAGKVAFPAIEAAQATGPVVEYGCGAGRILKAVAERGIDCIGLDVSATMLEHCRRHVPGVRQLMLVPPDGHIPLGDATASVVYSYAVLQHIARLSIFERAIDEMCRVLAPGGVLSLQTSCKDIANPQCEVRGRTWNFERLSIYPRGRLYVPRPNTTWFGVCIGFERLRQRLEANGLSILAVSHPIQGLWSALVMAKKKAHSA